ncbi:MAG: TenA family protein [Muribaculaceae bacterium]|nr:TenA family protein [Muribaculaceae bacterium]
MKWSEEAWLKAEPIYKSILCLPFVRELSSGTLSRERFLFYIEQDSIYLENYSKILAHIASRLPLSSQMEDFLRFASGGIMVEKILHESYLNNQHLSKLPTPTTLLYNSYEASMVLEPVEIETAAILPCFWVYQRVGEEILKMMQKDNPYSRWIETYGDESFAASTRRAIEICDELAEMSTPQIRERMTEAFIRCTKMEWMFWDSAYNLEKWKI